MVYHHRSDAGVAKPGQRREIRQMCRHDAQML